MVLGVEESVKGYGPIAWVGSILKLRVVTATRIYWGLHRLSKGYDCVPVREITKWLAFSMNDSHYDNY